MTAFGNLVVDPTDGSVLYASTGDGLFKSSDAAESWSLVLSEGPGTYSAAVDPASPSTIYVMFAVAFSYDLTDPGSFKVLRSDDGGVTWDGLAASALVEARLHEFQTTSGYSMSEVAFDTSVQPSALYVITDSKYWCSTDRGVTWTEADLDDQKLQTLFGGSQDPADGLRGKAIADPDTTGERTIFNAIQDPDDPATFYAITQGGLYKSGDGGASWKRADAGLTSSGASAVLVDPSRPSTLYATTPMGLLKSTDAGKTWTMCLRGTATKGGAIGASISAVMAPSDPSVLYAWTDEGVVRSDDAGVNWRALAGDGLLVGYPKFSGFADQVLLVSLDDPNVVFARGTEAIYRSADGGETWSQIRVGISVICPDPRDPVTLYALSLPLESDGTGEELYRSTDKGVSWQMLTTPRMEPWSCGRTTAIRWQSTH